MTEHELTAEIVLAEFVPPEARCPEVHRAVNRALATGDVEQLANVIRATQLQQQQQLDTHSRQITEIRQALSELQKTASATPVCNFYVDSRQWHHTDNSQKSASWSSHSNSEDNSHTVVSGVFDWLLWWAVGLALVSALASLCPEARVSVESPNPGLHKLHIRGGQL